MFGESLGGPRGESCNFGVPEPKHRVLAEAPISYRGPGLDAKGIAHIEKGVQRGEDWVVGAGSGREVGGQVGGARARSR